MISTFLVAQYNYSAFLQLWDYCIAGITVILLCCIFLESEDRIRRLSLWIFVAMVAGILVTNAIKGVLWELRIRGSFVNANDFAAFSLLLVLLGLYLYEHQSNQGRKILIATLMVVLGIFIALAASRGIFLAALLFFAAYFWKRKPSRLVVVSIAVIIAVGAVAIVPRFAEPFRYYRLKIWQHSLKGIMQDPYLGVGLGMLQYKGERFNFPADVEVGRYAFVARSADSQYFQILAETGFLGFFTFLIGWIAWYLAIRKVPDTYLSLKYSYLVVSFLCLFMLPLQNTAIFLLFLFLVTLPIAFASGARPICLNLGAVGRITMSVLLFLMFTFCVFLPYAADREMKAAIHSSDPQAAEEHFQKAIRYNPYQPYYPFFFVKRVVDARPSLTPLKWLFLVHYLNDSIRLNPAETDFYAYRAKIFNILFEQTHQLTFYSQAVSSYQAALDHAPYNVFLRGEFAYFLYRLGRNELAEAELRKALAAEPAYLNARLLLAEIKLKENDLAGARTVYLEGEKYYQLPGRIAFTRTDKYSPKLLEFDPQRKEELRKLLFKQAKEPAK